MMKNNILLFSLLMFMQVFVLNKILFFDYVLLAPYVLVLILYPYYKDSIITLVIGFLLGLIVDAFNDFGMGRSFSLSWGMGMADLYLLALAISDLGYLIGAMFCSMLILDVWGNAYKNLACTTNCFKGI